MFLKKIILPFYFFLMCFSQLGGASYEKEASDILQSIPILDLKLDFSKFPKEKFGIKFFVKGENKEITLNKYNFENCIGVRFLYSYKEGAKIAYGSTGIGSAPAFQLNKLSKYNVTIQNGDILYSEGLTKLFFKKAKDMLDAVPLASLDSINIKLTFNGIIHDPLLKDMERITLVCSEDISIDTFKRIMRLYSETLEGNPNKDGTEKTTNENDANIKQDI